MATTSKLQAFALGDLAVYHRNPNLGNTGSIEGSLRVNGQYRPIVVNRGTHTGRPNEVLAGNHTLKAMRNLAEAEPDDARWRSIDAYVVDVDNDQAARIVLADNKTAQDGFGYDNAALADLLGGLGDLAGTAFSDEEYSDLLAGLEEVDAVITDPLAGDEPIRVSRTGEDGLIASKDIETQAGEYAEASTRLMVLTLPINQFIWANEILAKFREEHGIDSNTEALLTMLADYSGDVPPIAPAAEDEVDA